MGEAGGELGRIFFITNESEMVGFDSRSGSQRVETQTSDSPETTAAATTPKTMSGKTVTQRLDSITGVVYAEATAGNAIAVAIDTRNSGKSELRVAGLMIDTEAELVGSKVALGEAMRDSSEAFHFAARTDAVHIETGVIINE